MSITKPGGDFSNCWKNRLPAYRFEHQRKLLRLLVAESLGQRVCARSAGGAGAESALDG